NAKSLHYKTDHLGKLVLNEKGEPVPVDFVSTGNNHHVAIYRDKNGNLQERVVSFMEAVTRKIYQLPLIFKNPKEVIDLILEKGIDNGLILENLPEQDWEFVFSLKQNEMFVFPNKEIGFDPFAIDLMNIKNRKLISPNLYRVQKIATNNYMFRHHLETNVEEKKELANIAFINIRTPKKLKGLIKVRINHIGEIVGVGEY